MQGTVQAHAAVQDVSPGASSATKRALVALAELVAASTPLSLDGVDARRHVDHLLKSQAEASWRTLRGRYPRIEVSAREFQVATTRAVDMVNDLFSPEERKSVAPLVRLALIAAVTRRLVIDGPEPAENSIKRHRHHEAGTALPAPRPCTALQ